MRKPRSVLVIQSFEENDYGKYSCITDNGIGIGHDSTVVTGKYTYIFTVKTIFQQVVVFSL